MREYTEGTKTIVKKVICNQCGKEIKIDDSTAPAEWLAVDKSWGYFSGKDGETHSFDLCEVCYDKLIRGFVLPATVEEQNELL